jgi:hypothetical protein
MEKDLAGARRHTRFGRPPLPDATTARLLLRTKDLGMLSRRVRLSIMFLKIKAFKLLPLTAKLFSNQCLQCKSTMAMLCLPFIGCWN